MPRKRPGIRYLFSKDDFLTAIQFEILTMICVRSQRGLPANMSAIKRAFGYKSINSVSEVVDKLKRLGLVQNEGDGSITLAAKCQIEIL